MSPDTTTIQFPEGHPGGRGGQRSIKPDTDTADRGEQDRNESCMAEDIDPCSSHGERSEQRRLIVQERRTVSPGTRRVFFIAKKERTVNAEEAT